MKCNFRYSVLSLRCLIHDLLFLPISRIESAVGKRLITHSELSMGWVDPWVGYGSRIFVVSGLGLVSYLVGWELGLGLGR